MQFKSLWKEGSSPGWSFFCPLCRANRKVAHRPAPTRKHYFQLGLTTVALTAALWPVFAWKGVVVFIPLAVAFEVIYRSHARVALNCPHCGFDPYLYLVDTKRARQEIETHWRKKFSEKGIPFPEKGQKASARPSGMTEKASPSSGISAESPADEPSQNQ